MYVFDEFKIAGACLERKLEQHKIDLLQGKSKQRHTPQLRWFQSQEAPDQLLIPAREYHNYMSNSKETRL